MTETAGTGTATQGGTTDGSGAATAAVTTDGSGTTDYKALYEAATADVDKWKSLSRKHEKQAKDNSEASQTAAQRQEALDKVLAALGVDGAGSKAPDIATITAQFEQEKAASRARAVELAVLRAAGRNGADGDALLDSRGFLNSLDGVDPTDTAAIADAVKAAVTANPRYALAADTAGQGANTGQQPPGQQPPPRQASSVGEFNGAPGGQRQWTQADVDRANPAQLEKAIGDGLLHNYLNS